MTAGVRATFREVLRANRQDGYGTKILARIGVWAVMSAGFFLAGFDGGHVRNIWIAAGASLVFGSLVAFGLVLDYREAKARMERGRR